MLRTTAYNILLDLINPVELRIDSLSILFLTRHNVYYDSEGVLTWDKEVAFSRLNPFIRLLLQSWLTLLRV